MLFGTNLELMAGETVTSLIVRATDSRSITYDLPVEKMTKVSNLNWLSSVIVRLPDDQSISGDILITVGLRGAVSNQVRVGVRAQ
jgi:hypothetical protein